MARETRRRDSSIGTNRRAAATARARAQTRESQKVENARSLRSSRRNMRLALRNKEPEPKTDGRRGRIPQRSARKSNGRPSAADQRHKRELSDESEDFASDSDSSADEKSSADDESFHRNLRNGRKTAQGSAKTNNTQRKRIAVSDYESEDDDNQSEGDEAEEEEESFDESEASQNTHSKATSDQDDDDQEEEEEEEEEEEGSSDDESEEAESSEEEDIVQTNGNKRTSTPRRNGRASRRSNASTESGEKDTRASYYFTQDLDLSVIRGKETMTRFRYLLGLGDLFRKFVDYRAQKDPEFKALLDEATKENRKAARAAIRGPAKSASSKSRTFRSNLSTDISEVEDMMDDEEKITVFTESPGFVTGKLRQYQIDGLNWLISLFLNDINGILADEMGLGKTFQTISFLAYLRAIQNIRGPHLVIAPKSTIQNWAREFATWTPDVDVLVIAGDKEARTELLKTRLMKAKFDVCITSYELLIREKNYLKKIAWQYIIVDEAHRLKNEESILSKLMRVLYSRHRLLITGTPLQNNLHELWALLNFLLPDVFSDAEVFDDWFSQDGDNKNQESDSGSQSDSEESSSQTTKNAKKAISNGTEREESGQVVDQLRSLLSPFLLRRVKRDVEHSLLPKKEINLYVGMTDMQIQWYQRLLEKDLDAVNSVGKGGTEKRMRLLNVVMQLRKCCNHPYLFEGAEPGPPFTTDEHLVYNSGKMILMDKLLKKLKAQGSRVLIFSQMSRMLDILEDFCVLRGYQYSRIDGSTQHEDRIASIDEYNRPGSDKFVFLLTTRAGGLGINLTTADQVIIYDSDWNPQADLQAMDRAHRIGQTKQVFVYRMIVERAIEEKVLERAAHKLRLDQLVIQQGSNRNSAQEKAKAAASKEELADMIRHGAQEVFDNKKGTNMNEMSIDELIANGEKRTKELNDKYVSLGLDELIKLTFDKPPSNQSPIVSKNPKQNLEDDYRHHRRRARNPAMFAEEAISFQNSKYPHTLRAPKQITLHDFQFYPPELQELQARELAWYRKAAGIRLSSEDYSEDEEDESEEANAEIDQAEPLTEEEIERKEKLATEGFPNFSRRDLFHFFHLVVELGGHERIDEAAIGELCKKWPEKSEEELTRYFKVFSERYQELSDVDRYLHMLEEGETKLRKQNERSDLLKRKVEATRTPMSTMRITQPTGGSASKHRFSESDDRFLLLQMYKYGLNDPDLTEKICEGIRTSGQFDFDWYFMSRTPAEIGRRCTSLLNVITKEENSGADASKTQKRKGRPPGTLTTRKNESKRYKVSART